MTAAEKAFYQRVPPRVTGPNVVQSGVTGVAAASLSLWAGLTGANKPRGKVMVTFESVTRAHYVRFGTTATTATTANNGTVIGIAGQATFWLDTAVDVFVDVLAVGGAGVLKWYVSSPVYDNEIMVGTV